MNICKKCGANLDGTINYCQNCGEKLNQRINPKIVNTLFGVGLALTILRAAQELLPLIFILLS